MAQRVMTGSRARFFLNGKKMGMAFGLTINDNITQEAINTLDMLEVLEFATTGYNVTLRCQIYRVPNSDIVAAGLWPQMGNTSEELKRLFLGFAPMTAEIYDTHVDTYVGKLVGIVPVSRTLNIQARGIVANDCSFNAIKFADEGSPNV